MTSSPIQTLGEIDFRPLLASHRKAKEMGVPQEQIVFALDMLLADVRERLLADDDRVVWAVLASHQKTESA